MRRFPDISNDVALVGNIVLVWLTNIHYRDITFDGTKANERDRGYKNLKTLLQNIKEEKDTFGKNITTPVAISRFMYKEDHLKNKIRRILDKK